MAEYKDLEKHDNTESGLRIGLGLSGGGFRASIFHLGVILRLEELSSLLDRQPHTTTVRTERPLWDNWLVVLLLVALMGFEWIVRRRYDLP